MKVRIRATETVCYDKIVEMTDEEHRELQELLDEHPGCYGLDLDDIWLHPNEVINSEGINHVELIPVKDEKADVHSAPTE